MLKTGILNPHLLSLLARARHTNTLVIADRGFPCWPQIETVDLSLVDNVPTVLEVLRAIRPKFVIGQGDRKLTGQGVRPDQQGCFLQKIRAKDSHDRTDYFPKITHRSESRAGNVLVVRVWTIEKPALLRRLPQRHRTRTEEG